MPYVEKTRTEGSWIEQRYAALNKAGWTFVTSRKDGLIPSAQVGAHDVKTSQLVTQWTTQGTPVEMSIVLISTDGVLGLPMRALAYASSALNFAVTLREKFQVNVDTLRVLSPCHSNVYANGGDIQTQLDNAVKTRQLVEAYKEAYLPELQKVTVTLDTGHPITPDTETNLKPHVEQIQQNYPDIVNELSGVALRYNQDGFVGDGSYLPRAIVYLLTHPPAWGYAEEEILFARNGKNRVNYMPASELRYLELMRRLEGQVWTPALDKQIATVISARQKRAPYYPFSQGPWGVEATIEDLTETEALGKIAGKMTKEPKYRGVLEVGEILVNLNGIRYDVESANNRRKRMGLGSAPTLAQVIASAL